MRRLEKAIESLQNQISNLKAKQDLLPSRDNIE